MKKSIIVAGSIIVDTINEISAYPKKGCLEQVFSIKKSLGGLVPNVGIDLKRIDPELHIYAVGQIGDDENGKFVIDSLEKEKIDTSLISINKKTPTSVDFVMSEQKGERTFFAYSGTNNQFCEKDIKLDRIKCDMLHLGYFLFMEKLDNGDGAKILKRAKQLGIKTSIDFVSDDNESKYRKIWPCLPFVDNLIINEIEASKLAGLDMSKNSIKDILLKLKNMGVIERIIVHSPKKSYLFDGKEYLEQNSLFVDKKYIKGTTGAGDAFCAGALYSICCGSTNKEILEFATMCAAMSLKSIDATSAMRCKKEIVKNGKTLSRR